MLRCQVVLAVPLVCLAAAGCGRDGSVPVGPPAVAPAFVFLLTPQDTDKNPAQLSVFQVEGKNAALAGVVVRLALLRRQAFEVRFQES